MTCPSAQHDQAGLFKAPDEDSWQDDRDFGFPCRPGRLCSWRRATPEELELPTDHKDRRVPAELGQESQASSCVEEWNSTGLSSCSPDNRPLVELCVEPAVLSGRCMGVSVPLRFLPSYTGLPSKRYPAFRFLSRADQEISVFRHVAPPTSLRLEFLLETDLNLRCTRKVGNPFRQSK